MTTTDIIEDTMTAAEMISLTKRHSIFSWSAQASVNPIAMTRGEGIYSWDADSDATFTQRCLDEVEEIVMYEGGHTIAAMFVETVTGTNGLIVPPDGYLQGLRAICDRHGIFLVCDEVMCGLGRTGRWFAADHWNVIPDMITIAKGLTSANLPLGTDAVSDGIVSYFDDNIIFGILNYNSPTMSLGAT